jgi:hypothetical protein
LRNHTVTTRCKCEEICSRASLWPLSFCRSQHPAVWRIVTTTTGNLAEHPWSLCRSQHTTVNRQAHVAHQYNHQPSNTRRSSTTNRQNTRRPSSSTRQTHVAHQPLTVYHQRSVINSWSSSNINIQLIHVLNTNHNSLLINEPLKNSTNPLRRSLVRCCRSEAHFSPLLSPTLSTLIANRAAKGHRTPQVTRVTSTQQPLAMEVTAWAGAKRAALTTTVWTRTKMMTSF